MKRVVITGAGAISPLGHDWPSVLAKLHTRRNVVRVMDEWENYEGLHTRLGVQVAPFTLPEHYTRKATRSMGRVAIMATRSAELALEQAGLLGDPVLKSGHVGIAYGSSTGSTSATADFGRMIVDKSVEGITANTYIRMMSHTAPVNIGVFFGITGRIVTTSSACTSGSQGIGYAFEMIRAGKQRIMVAGGAEELDVTEAAVFDTLFATSVKYNERPALSPRPFDTQRDGLVLGEGACTLILEELSHAQARGASILAEIVGFGTNSDGSHVTHPSSDTMAQAMRLALDDAGVTASQLNYVNAHGTATEHGDVAETAATHAVFGERIAISSLKSYIGHTMGACGALETWMTVQMMREGWFAPTLNLEQVDPRCAPLDYITGTGRQMQLDIVMSNNFAFGGINTSLLMRRWQD